MDIKAVLTALAAIALFLLIRIRDRKKYGSQEGHIAIETNRSGIDAALSLLNETFHCPFPHYQIPDEIHMILRREPRSEYGLQLFLQSIAQHCDYHRHQLELHIYNQEEGAAPGRISYRGGNRYVIELHMAADCRRETIMAVLIHEFCHFYLDQHGIGYEVTRENEILTDVSSVYFGFGNFMRAGYRPSVETGSGNNHLYWVGYICVSEIDYAEAVCEKMAEDNL